MNVFSKYLIAFNYSEFNLNEIPKEFEKYTLEVHNFWNKDFPDNPILLSNVIYRDLVINYLINSELTLRRHFISFLKYRYFKKKEYLMVNSSEKLRKKC